MLVGPLQVPAIAGLSVLELCMLVAAQKLEDRQTAEFNFEVRQFLNQHRACVPACKAQGMQKKSCNDTYALPEAGALLS